MITSVIRNVISSAIKGISGSVTSGFLLLAQLRTTRLAGSTVFQTLGVHLEENQIVRFTTADDGTIRLPEIVGVAQEGDHLEIHNHMGATIIIQGTRFASIDKVDSVTTSAIFFEVVLTHVGGDYMEFRLINKG